MPNGMPWTKEEDAFLRLAYPVDGWDIADYMSRTKSAIRGRAKYLGISSGYVVTSFDYSHDKVYINLSNSDLLVLIDLDDLNKVQHYRWSLSKTGYVEVRNNRKMMKLHRLIMGLHGKDPILQVDHKDGNPLNNTKSNLRICTNTENARNSRKPTGRYYTSKYKGVSRNSRNNNWRARIQYNAKLINIGYFNNEKIAAIAYNNKAKELFGEFAWLNKID